MIVTPERIAANKANARKSTGPRTPEGKIASRANGLKHGLTGDGIVLPKGLADDVAAMTRDLRLELRPATQVGSIMVDRMALMAVRLDRCAAEELGRLAAMNDGEGGLIDFSAEGQLAFKYEMAASRAFFKAHAEYRKAEAEARTRVPDPSSQPVAVEVVATPEPPPSFVPLASSSPMDFLPSSWIEEPAAPLWPSPTRTPSGDRRPRLPRRK